MYTYRKRNKTGPGSIIFIALFLLTAVGLGYLAYTDRGMFWDYMPLASIGIVVLSLIFAIFNLVRRNAIGFLFILFLLASIAGIVVSSLFGPFALNLRGQNFYEEQNYQQAIVNLETIVEQYPSSRYHDSALGVLPFAYYRNGNCRRALDYLDQGIGSGLLDSNLETSLMYTQCHLSIAESSFEQNNYGTAAAHYLAAVNLYKELKQNYPDTDEAFIADYKIPELTFKAATAYKQAGNREKSNEILSTLIDQYPQSEYAQRAQEMLFANYVNTALILKNEREYMLAVEEFLKITELFASPQDAFRVSHYREVIFSDMPQFYLEQAGLQFYNQQDYKKSAYIYQAIFEYYPQSSEDYISYLVKSKINLIESINYRNLSLTGEPAGRYSEDISILEVENTGIYDAVLYLSGPQNLRVDLKSGTINELELLPGTYQVAVEFSTQPSIPLLGNLSLEPGRKHLLAVGL